MYKIDPKTKFVNHNGGIQNTDFFKFQITKFKSDSIKTLITILELTKNSKPESL